MDKGIPEFLLKLLMAIQTELALRIGFQLEFVLRKSNRNNQKRRDAKE
jgi:hypothetical protein